MEEQDVTSRLQADNGRLAEDNARLRAQLLAATTGNPQDEQFVVVARESLTRWSAQLREGCADNESGCCTECGAYLASMPHLDDCSWVPLTDEIDRHAALQPMAPDIPAAQLDCSLAPRTHLAVDGFERDGKQPAGTRVERGMESCCSSLCNLRRPGCPDGRGMGEAS